MIQRIWDEMKEVDEERMSRELAAKDQERSCKVATKGEVRKMLKEWMEERWTDGTKEDGKRQKKKGEEREQLITYRCLVTRPLRPIQSCKVALSDVLSLPRCTTGTLASKASPSSGYEPPRTGTRYVG